MQNDKNTGSSPDKEPSNTGVGTTIPPVTATNNLGDIGAKLGASVAKQEEIKKVSNEPIPETPLPFDMAKLTGEQLKQLKSMLAVTPEQSVPQDAGHKTKIRTMGGRCVIAIKNAFLSVIYDPAMGQEKNAEKMPVKFLGDEDYTEVLWKDFMESPRVECEIVSTREEKSVRKEGKIIQRETGRLIDMEVKMVTRFITIKLPSGQIVEIENSASNA
jgi:hypothetical protein